MQDAEKRSRFRSRPYRWRRLKETYGASACSNTLCFTLALRRLLLRCDRLSDEQPRGWVGWSMAPPSARRTTLHANASISCKSYASKCRGARPRTIPSLGWKSHTATGFSTHRAMLQAASRHCRRNWSVWQSSVYRRLLKATPHPACLLCSPRLRHRARAHRVGRISVATSAST